MSLWQQAENVLEAVETAEAAGVVTDVIGLIIEGSGPPVGLGTTCLLTQGELEVHAQVVGFRHEKILLMPFGELSGLAPGAKIVATGYGDTVNVGEELLGRVIDPLVQPLDGRPLPPLKNTVPLVRRPPSPMERVRISQSLDTGVKVVDTMLRIGKGQRVAIMAGSGVGKSTFMGMIARHGRSAVNVIALVGERGREVREFIERDLGPEGLASSVVVVATSDSGALPRIRAAFVATAIAEYFRDLGHDVTLMVDSITRLCMSQREIGLAVGEPPSSAGYTPSVFAMLPKLLERAGTGVGAGSISGFYTVLVEGDDMNEPIADAVRGILDGHIILSRSLAAKGQFPAVDVLPSISRLMSDLATEEEKELAQRARKVLADYAEVEDLITIGAYKAGQNPKVDYAVERIEPLREFLRQKPEEGVSLLDSENLLAEVLYRNEQ